MTDLRVPDVRDSSGNPIITSSLPSEAPTSSLIASAHRVDLSVDGAVKRVLNIRQKWQRQAIDDINAIGQLQYGVSIPAALSSRVNYFIATEADEVDSAPIRVLDKTGDAKVAIDTLARLGNTLTITDLIYNLAFNLLGPGECYLICIAARPSQSNAEGQLIVPATPERWVVRSINDVEPFGSSLRTFDELTHLPVVLDQEGDTYIRIWNPDPFRSALATSHVRAVMSSAEELLWWQASASAAAKNRLVTAGMIGIPDNLDLPSDSATDSRLSGNQRFLNKVMDTMMASLKDPTGPAGAVPLLFSYPTNDQGKSGVEVIEYKREHDELLERRTERCLIDIEQGINLPVGVVSGLGSTTHWGGGMVEESVFRDHVEPLVILICSALTRAFLWPILALKGVPDPTKYFIWYDPSNLIVHRDKSANALRARELLIINETATRRELGYKETDKMERDEKDEFIEDLGAVRRGPSQQGIVGNPSETTSTPTDPNAPPSQNAPGDRTSEDTKTATTRGRGRKAIAASANGHSPLIAQLQVLCDEKCRRALEVAGNRLRNRIKGKRNSQWSSAISGIPSIQVAATLGREAVVTIGASDLFDGAFSDISSRLYVLTPDDAELDIASSSQNLTAHLRAVCAEALFTPPDASLMVTAQAIEESLVLA